MTVELRRCSNQGGQHLKTQSDECVAVTTYFNALMKPITADNNNMTG
jgi:hypothetical protein